METRKEPETICVPKSGKVRLDLSVKVANQNLFSASYVLVPAVSAEVNSAPKELCEAWEQVKRRIEQYEIQSWQISRWFMRHHEIDADLDDFTSETLPSKFTVAQLKGFCGSVDRHLSQR